MGSNPNARIDEQSNDGNTCFDRIIQSMCGFLKNLQIVEQFAHTQFVFIIQSMCYPIQTFQIGEQSNAGHIQLVFIIQSMCYPIKTLKRTI